MTDSSEKIDSALSQHASESKIANVSVVELAREGFGKGASRYDEFRPSYTDNALDVIMKELALDAPPGCLNLMYEVLELGAGTGKFTEGLVSKLPQLTRYLAIEPSRNFLDLLEAKSLPVQTSLAAADNMPLPAHSVQNIVCAQCFHWFSNEASLREISRVLIPGGKLILVWNAKKYEGWMQEVYRQRFEVIERAGGSTSNWFNSMQWREALDAASSSLFLLSQHYSLPGFEIKGTLNQVMSNVSTVSAYNSLPEADRWAYLDKLKEAILAWPGVDSERLVVTHTSEVYVYTSQKQ